MPDFVIDRSYLLTGTALKVIQAAGFDPVLYDKGTGLSCLLGQYLLSMGVSPEHLAGQTQVSNLSCALPSDASEGPV